MKKLIPICLFAFFTLSGVCQKGSSITLTKQESCDVFTMEEVAKVLDVDVSSLVNEDMSFVSNKKRSVCHIVAKGKISSFNVRMAWKSEKAQANKALERSFSTYLTSGEKDMEHYEEITSNDDTQILYGTQKGRQGTNHIIRKRFGNASELKIEVIRETLVPDMKNTLLNLVQKIK